MLAFYNFEKVSFIKFYVLLDVNYVHNVHWWTQGESNSRLSNANAA